MTRHRLARLSVTEAEIDRVVARFYSLVRQHPVLGPIFRQSLTDSDALWRAHEAQIGRFWRNALLRQREYDGNPMMIHAGVMATKPEHFGIWLGLFDKVLTTELDPKTAAGWSALAHRIGDGLRLGLGPARARFEGVPDLTR